MAFPRDPRYTYDASGIMIPEVWSSKLLVKFYSQTVFGDIANTDYEGEIKDQGDTVHIRTTPDIAITNHAKGQKITYQMPEPQLVDLLIDKGKSWAFEASQVDLTQADYDFASDWTDDAGRQLKISIDTDILADIHTDSDAANAGDTAGKISGDINLGTAVAPLQVTKDNVLDTISEFGVVLDEQDVPAENRWAVLPAWMCGMIGKSELRGANFAGTNGEGNPVLRNGYIGDIYNFRIYQSNLLYVDSGNTYSIFGQRHALSFASQLILNEGPFKHPDYFGDFYRGLQIYGYNVNKPEAMGTAIVTK